MGNLLRIDEQARKEKLINRLIALKVYKKEDKHLYEMSVKELEFQFRMAIAKNHPHSDMGSLRWKKKRA
ncbi:Fur-regulated basic protein FbpA [Niallia sp. NCCP-28]|uniref:Fur-regulated basic protein FbpA n=1 Tax=Niallia sp. NCCP-28 TaxID=2934712 RepID=UPI0020831290|nr:Fur-regulated basic protein FbpA [Niallia sp. NCCP-28]GKU84716.1 hypothetical protein NCCP28_41120 [Niallia sp. NCCP-28]